MYQLLNAMVSEQFSGDLTLTLNFTSVEEAQAFMLTDVNCVMVDPTVLTLTKIEIEREEITYTYEAQNQKKAYEILSEYFESAEFDEKFNIKTEDIYTIGDLKERIANGELTATEEIYKLLDIYSDDYKVAWVTKGNEVVSIYTM